MKIRRKTFSRGHRGLFFIGIGVLRSLSECSRDLNAEKRKQVGKYLMMMIWGL